MSLFHDAALSGDLAMLKRIGKRDLLRHDEDGLTPLHCAAKGGSLDAAKLLVVRGADANLLDGQGRTCLHVAAAHGHIALLRHLVETGIGNVWSLDDNSQTACELAVEHRHMAAIRYLEAVQIRLQKEHHTAAEKAKTKALKEFNKRLAARTKQEAKASGKSAKRKTSSTSSSSGSVETSSRVSRTRAFSDPVDPAMLTLSGSASSKSSGGSKGKSSKAQRSTGRDAASALQQAQPHHDDQTRPGFGLRDKFSLRPSQPSLPLLASQSSTSDSSLLVPKSKTGRINRMEQAVDRLRNLGGIDTGDDSLLAKALAQLPADSDVETATSTRSETRRKRKRAQSTSALRHGSSDTELSEAQDRGKRQRQTSLDETAPVKKKSHASAAELAEGAERTELASFIHMLDLDDLLPLLEEEQMDMTSLMLCSDGDLRDLDMPLGPRRKILAAVRQRKSAVTSPGRLTDSHV